MKIEVEVGDIAVWKDEAVVVNLFEGVKRPGGATGAVDRALGGMISKIIEAGDFHGKFKEVYTIPTMAKIPATRVIIVGLGNKKDFSIDRVREASGRAALHARDLGLKSYSTVVHGAGIGGKDLSKSAEAVSEGTLLALYRFSRYKSKEEENKGIDGMKIVINDKRKVKAVQKAVESATVIASSTNLVRDLVNIPGNDKPPKRLAEMAVDIARKAGIKSQVIDEKKLSELGLNAILAVGRGSTEPPRLLVLSYEGSKKAKAIALVGKGITFDTGGISLKPQEGPLGSMTEMRHDMTGMAVVLGVMNAAARLKLPINLIGLTPLAENMPSGNAQRPGDVIKSFDGKTIEVINTDAEGRLILADALAYSQKWEPQATIDIATLTGASIIALGRRITAMLGNDSKLLKRIKNASESTGEQVWELPLFDEFKNQLKSDIADISNTGGRSAGTITAAMFLKEFVGDTPWVHLDIAGSCWVRGDRESIDKAYMPKGPSGVGVRLLVDALRSWNKPVR